MNSARLASAIARTYFPQTEFAQLPQSVQAFIKAARAHDWTWYMADDGNSYRKGQASEKQLKKQAANLLTEFSCEEVLEIVNRTFAACSKSRGIGFTPINAVTLFEWAGQKELGL